MPSFTPLRLNGHSGYVQHQEEMRRNDDDPYRRQFQTHAAAGNGHPLVSNTASLVSNRDNTDRVVDEHNMPNFNNVEPFFEMDHLATFSAVGGPKKGTMHFEDGLRKLQQMEKTTGIWTMCCIMALDRNSVVIIEKNSNEELERFPLHLIVEPTAVFKNDRREIYNNLVFFTVLDNHSRKGCQADMHIFHSLLTPAQTVVDEIIAFKTGKSRVPKTGYTIPPPPSIPAPIPPCRKDMYDFSSFYNTLEPNSLHPSYIRSIGTGQPDGSQMMERFGASHLSGAMQRPSYKMQRDGVVDHGLLERDVQLLNHCFDDIEMFVARLQQVAVAYKELDRRSKERRPKAKIAIDGMLSRRARPPPAQDFVDIFQKFKLSFNLLAKLKAHIHHPNSPELIHLLFTPLALILEASRDQVYSGGQLAAAAVAPVLAPSAKQLLLHCLTSNEMELWNSLGERWTVSKDEWKGDIPPYLPHFYDGWHPVPVSSEAESRPDSMPNTGYGHAFNKSQDRDPKLYTEERTLASSPQDRHFRKEWASHQEFHTPNHRSDSSAGDFGGGIHHQGTLLQHNRYGVVNEEDNRFSEPAVLSPASPKGHNGNEAYRDDMLSSGAAVFEVVHERQGKNSKELTVAKGHYLQILDDSRNWWKVRNWKGEIGFCPYTILKELVPPQ